VLAQDTGFGAFLPVGDGLLRFSTTDDALEAIDGLQARYAAHSDAARMLAEDTFSSRKVLPQLLDRLGAA
jgi:hypothetical protein